MIMYYHNIILVMVMAGVACTQGYEAAGMCSTRELRRAELDKKLDALQCDNYVCGE